MSDQAQPYPSDEQLQARAQQIASQQVEAQIGGLALARTSAEAMAAVYREQVVSLRDTVDHLRAQLGAAQANRPAAPPKPRRR